MTNLFAIFGVYDIMNIVHEKNKIENPYFHILDVWTSYRYRYPTS